MKKTAAILAGALCALTIGLTIASPASATGLSWGLVGCARVPTGRGGWSSATCSSVRAGGNYARAYLAYTGLTLICLWEGGLGFGMMADPGCFFLNSLTGGYRLWADPPTLSVTVKGGAYKMQGTLLGIKVTTNCTSMEAKEAKIESGGASAGKTEAASLEYKGCVLETPSKCEINSPGKAGGTVATNAVESELVENAAKTKVEDLFKAKTGTIFEELEFKNKGTETCLLKGSKFSISGSTLTEGGAEDEIKNADKFEVEGKTEEAGEAVEKAKLISEPASRKYIKNGTGEEAEAKLKIGETGEVLSLSGEATGEAKFSGGGFTNEETLGEISVEEGPVDLGVERE